MNDRWIKFNKVLLIVSMIVGFIIVIALTVIFADKKLLDSNSWIVFLVGSFFVLVVHAIWGLFIEMADNLYSCNERNIHFSETEHNNMNTNSVANRWVCKKCGTSNKNTLNFCTHCGESKEQNIGNTQ